MPLTKIHCEQSDDLDAALRSIAERWNGDLSAYLKSMAQAKQIAEQKEEHNLSRSAANISRLSKRR